MSELSEKYENVRVLNSEKGVSKARNKGIQEAEGKWIVFLDADDVCLKEIEEGTEKEKIRYDESIGIRNDRKSRWGGKLSRKLLQKYRQK